MTDNFICQRCGAKVLGEAYDNNDVQCVEEEHYDCKCGFSWHWAYGHHLSESTIYQESPEYSKVDVAYVCGGYKQFRVQTSTQDDNVNKWSDKIALIQKCTPKEAIPRQLNLLGSLIAQDTSLSENDKTALRKIWQDAFNACKKKASDTNADTIIEKIKHIEGLNIEICGTWLWVSGDTKPHKDFLNEVGLFWAGAKKMWYWKPKEAKTKNFKSVDIGYIREKYGREVIKAVS